MEATKSAVKRKDDQWESAKAAKHGAWLRKKASKRDKKYDRETKWN